MGKPVPNIEEKFDATLLQKYVKHYNSTGALDTKFEKIQQISKILKEDVVFFRGFSIDFTIDMVKVSELLLFNAGSYIFYEKDICDSTYIILSGYVKCDYLGAVTKYGSGDTFGEEA